MKSDEIYLETETSSLSRPNDGCPVGTVDGISTCFCSDHCSWNTCRLKIPPNECTSVASWRWDSQRLHWIAQGNQLITV